MMRTKILFLLLFTNTILFAQIKNDSVAVKVNQRVLLAFPDGSSITGLVSDHSIDSIGIQSKRNSVSRFHRKDISKISLRENKRVKYRNPSFNHDRLLLTHTGYTLPVGTQEYRTHYGLLHTYHIGLNNIELGVGVGYPAFIMTSFKMGFPYKKSSGGFAAGLKYYLIPFNLADDPITSLHLYLAFTFGSPNQSFTFSLNSIRNSEGLNDELDISIDSRSVFSLVFGSRFRVQEHWQILFENTISTASNNFEVGLLPSFGITWFNDRHSVELAYRRTLLLDKVLLPIVVVNQFNNLPYISYAFRF